MVSRSGAPTTGVDQRRRAGRTYCFHRKLATDLRLRVSAAPQPSARRLMDTTWRTILRYALLLVAVSTTIGPRAGAQQPRADIILVNGRILTVDANDRVAQAVAIAGNRIIAVGSTAEIERTAGPNTRRVDLRGHAVTPGLLDAHAHFSGGGARSAVRRRPQLSQREEHRRRRRGDSRQGRVERERRVDSRTRLGRRQARRTPADHREGSRRSRAGQSGVPHANDGALRRREQRGASTRGSAQGHARRRPAARSIATPTARRPACSRKAAMELVRRLIPPRSARRDRGGHARLRQSVQRRGHDRAEGSRHLVATWDSTRRSRATARSPCACSRCGGRSDRSTRAQAADRRARGDDASV